MAPVLSLLALFTVSRRPHIGFQSQTARFKGYCSYMSKPEEWEPNLSGEKSGEKKRSLVRSLVRRKGAFESQMRLRGNPGWSQHSQACPCSLCVPGACHAVAELLSQLRGPWALIFWHQATSTLWFGRDVMGESQLVSGTAASLMFPSGHIQGRVKRYRKE